MVSRESILRGPRSLAPSHPTALFPGKLGPSKYNAKGRDCIESKFAQELLLMLSTSFVWLHSRLFMFRLLPVLHAETGLVGVRGEKVRFAIDHGSPDVTS